MSNQWLHFGIVYMTAIPCEQVIHFVRGRNGNVNGVAQRFLRQCPFT